MPTLYYVPEWFFGASISLEVLFSVITFSIAFYSYKIFKLSQQKEHRLFSISFLLISFSYIIIALLNIFLLTKLKDGILFFPVSSIIALNNIFFYMHALLFITGLVTIVYMIVKTHNIKLYFLLIILAVMPIIFSTSRLWLLYPISAILFLFIALHYFLIYINNKNKRTLISLSAFILLFISRLEFILASKEYIHFIFGENHGMHYVFGHALEAVAYILLLTNLASIIKHEQKKK